MPGCTEVSAGNALRALARRFAMLADACLPSTCIVCAANEPSGFCAACAEALPGSASARCLRCGIRVRQAGDECDACIAAPPAFVRTAVLADYAAPLDRVVHALKFGRDASLAPALGRRLARRAGEALATLPAALRARVVVTAVPLSERRLAERGFNQSLEIARVFARSRGLALDHRLLVRRHDSAPASTLHANERRQALRGAFCASRRADGQTIVVVDDVMTTGATLEAAAEALMRSGAAAVVNCVVARTPER